MAVYAERGRCDRSTKSDSGAEGGQIYEVKRKLLRKGVVVRKKLGLKADLEEGRQ